MQEEGPEDNCHGPRATPVQRGSWESLRVHGKAPLPGPHPGHVGRSQALGFLGTPAQHRCGYHPGAWARSDLSLLTWAWGSGSALLTGWETWVRDTSFPPDS